MSKYKKKIKSFNRVTKFLCFLCVPFFCFDILRSGVYEAVTNVLLQATKSS